MSHLDRKAAIICTTICFAGVTTGVILQLHLLSNENPEQHDSKHCSVCQQLLIAPGKFVLEPELALETGGQIERYVNTHSTICVKQFHHQQLNPRPPPATI
ncbi:MAG: hypothetical protein JXA81_01010 [Sedimentisphaerales bacterium]|nr:hypothetical protein [Sedimentisphaerales bacterium]